MNQFGSAESDHIVDVAETLAVTKAQQVSDHEPEPERGSTHGFFSAGYGAIGDSNKDDKDGDNERRDQGG